MIRGISENVLNKYGAYTDTNKLYMPYFNNNFIQERWLNDTKVKDISSKQFIDVLYGSHVFPAGGEQLIIVEGEIEALVVAESFSRSIEQIPPIVSTTCRVSFPIPMLSSSINYINSFDSIVLAFDNDTTGYRQHNFIMDTILNNKLLMFDIMGRKDNYELIKEIGYECYSHEFSRRTKKVIKKQEVSGWGFSK